MAQGIIEVLGFIRLLDMQTKKRIWEGHGLQARWKLYGAGAIAQKKTSARPNKDRVQVEGK